MGDINDYPGKKKLILSGFHEAALAAFAVKEHMRPGEKGSSAIHHDQSAAAERLGVSGEAGDSAPGTSGARHSA